MMHFLSDANETFENLTKKEYPFAFMLACGGYLIIMLADCVISSFFGKQNSRADVELQDELSIEQKGEIGWLLKLLFAGIATALRSQFFLYMDERRMKIVEMGGAEKLLNMLSTAKDDRTWKAALKTLAALSNTVASLCH